MKRCTRCILPESFPGISFDSEGVCSTCNKFNKTKEFIPSLEELQVKLTETITISKAKNLKYHAVVAYSGGKDSTFLIYFLIKEFGLNILAVTFDNGFMSEYSLGNIHRVLNTLNVDHVLIRPNLSLMKKVFLACTDSAIYPGHLTKFGSAICISCIRMVANMSLRIAIEKQIPMVMLGNSPGQLIQSENEIIFQDNKIPFMLRKKLFQSLAAEVGDEIYYYVMLTETEYKVKPFPYFINAFPLIGYNEDKIYRTIKTLGWKRPSDVDLNSTNCRLNSLGIIKHKERYNFHPYEYEMSMLIRLGIITREKALMRIEDPDKKASILAEQVQNELMS